MSLFLYTSVVYADQEKPLPLSDYFTQVWNTHDGLPHNGVNALAQTADGYLWIATWEGLARFNGRTFKVFDRGSEAGLPDSAVKALAVNPNGSLLVAGARGGISERKQRRWLHQPLATTMVLDILYDQQNPMAIWIALEGKGLVYRDRAQQKELQVLSDIRVYQITQDSQNIIWAATNKGLFSVENKTIVKHYDKESGLPDIPAYSVLINHKKQLIVGTEQGVYVRRNNHFSLLIPQLETETVISLLEDSRQDLWLGTSNHGLFRLSPYGLEKLNDNKGLPNNRISSLYEDKEKSIWVGTSSGLFRLREAPFITLTSEQGLAGDYIRSVMSHSDGSLWVGSSMGLSKIIERSIENINSPDPKNPVSVLSLAENIQAEVLVGSYNQGLFKVVDKKLVPFLDNKSGLPSNEVRSILYDSKNNLWVGTTSGLVRFSPEGKQTFFGKTSGLPDNFIMALAEDKQGRIWIGTGLGIASYNQGLLEIYLLNKTFDAEYAFGFYEETSGLWLATDRGLIYIDFLTDNMTAITRENGLPVDKIFQVIIDDKDFFWLTSNRGIIKIARSEINKVFKNNHEKINYEMFSEGVGLLSSQANGGSTPAATLHHDGSIWFATAKGVSQVTHERLKHVSEKEIPVVIEAIIVDGKNYPISDHQLIELPAGSSRITIYYAGIGFLNAKHIQYQTQLVGFDKYWLDKTNQTYSEFTNLAPKQYTFKIRAKYPNGEWRNNIAQLTFSVAPYFWQTTFFKLFVSLLLVFCLYAFYRYRIMRIKLNEKRLQRLVAKQTRDLKKQAESFAYQATHDQLTGLSNRRAFDAWCEVDFQQAQQEGNNLSLAILDIDHFKRVNDGYSHMVGDKIIKMVADLLQQLLENCPFSVKLARWGGEEFTLLIASDKKQAYEFCEYIRKKVAEHDFFSAAKGLHVTVSIGLTDNKEVYGYDKMINHADQALYYAKHNGRNQVRIFQASVDDLLCQPKPRA